MKIHKYLGKPWVSMARGPKAFDCWGIVKEFYEKELGINLPSYVIDPPSPLNIARAFRDGEKKRDWIEINELEDNCVVLMSSKTASFHIGVCVSAKESLILHSVEGQVSCCQNLKFIMDTMTAQRVRFFRHGKVSNN